MKKTKANLKSETNAPIWWISGGLVVVTLYFQMRVIDPFNSPKFWILLLTSSALLGYIVDSRKILLEFPSLKLFFYLILTFVSATLVLALVTDNRYTAFFGETQRRNGALSYLALATVMLASALFIRFFNIYKLLVAIYFVAAITILYALMQTTGNDFVAWNNQYNPIITTLGNPNFAAAVMAIMGVIIFSTIFISSIKIQYRVAGVFVCLLLLSLIERSDAKQGLLAYAIGVGIFLIIYLWIRNKWIGMGALLVGLVIFIGGILGMLQIGPLEKLLYKNSVTLRGYYWRAGIEMFQNNPIFGVGIDRYGSYFKQYRELNYPLNHGFEITSTNAHNTFIQFFATGGLFLGFMYLILNFFILRSAVIAFKRQQGDKRLIISGITCAWIAFHAQSLVSIDNLGVSIWGWVLGGSIIGLSISSSEHVGVSKQRYSSNKTEIPGARILISGGVKLLTVILIALLYTGEANAYKAMGAYDLENPQVKAIYRDINLGVLESVIIDPSYKLISAENLIQAGFTEEGLTALESISRNDSRNLDVLHSLANMSAQLVDPTSAIKYREIIAQLDPWNAKNYLALGQLYKVQGDSIKSKLMLDKILSFAPNLPIAEQAKIELTF